MQVSDLSHNILSLRISRTFKECLIKYLADETRASTTVKYRSGKSKSFLAIGKQILTLMNQLLCDTDKYKCRNVKKDFWKEDCSGKASGIFTESGPIGMLEGANFNNMDLFLRLFGKLVNSMCRSLKTASVLSVLVDFADFNNFVCIRFSSRGWSKNKIGDLATQIDEFKQKRKHFRQ